MATTQMAEKDSKSGKRQIVLHEHFLLPRSLFVSQKAQLAVSVITLLMLLMNVYFLIRIDQIIRYMLFMM